MPTTTPTPEQLAARLEPGELARLEVTATDHPDRKVRRAAAAALGLLQGRSGTGRGAAPASDVPPTPARRLPAGARPITAAQATALAEQREAAWDRFERDTFGADR